MNLFVLKISLVVVFLFAAQDFAFAAPHNKVGRSVSDAWVYKGKKSQKTITDQGYDALAALKRIDDKKAKRSNRSGVAPSSSEVFPLRTVNGEVITNLDVLNTARLMFFFSGKEYNSQLAKLMAPAILDSLEDDKLRQQCANLFGMAINQKDVDDKLADLAKSNGYTEAALINKLKAAGISLDVLKNYIKSKMIFQLIVQAFVDKDSVSNAYISEVRKDEESKLNSKRYCIIEIFRYDEKSANLILNLIKEGFGFQILAENLSQDIKKNKDLVGWMKESSFEPEVLNVIKSLRLGEHSGIIKTKAGYKIVLLLDKAEPGCAGLLETEYKILQTKVKYKGNLFTQKDAEKAGEVVQKFLTISNRKDFDDYCKEHQLEVEEKELHLENPYYMELINRCKDSGKAAVLQSQDDENSVTVVFLVSETSPKAKMPTEEELSERATEKKLSEDFGENFKKLKSSSHINDLNKERGIQ